MDDTGLSRCRFYDKRKRSYKVGARFFEWVRGGLYGNMVVAHVKRNVGRWKRISKKRADRLIKEGKRIAAEASEELSRQIATRRFTS